MENLSSKKLYSILVTTMFASFMNPFMLSAVNIALPTIQNEFGCSATQLGWVTNTFLLANAIMLLPLSKASDIFGRVRFFRLGLLLFSIFTFFTALSPTIEILLFARALQGIGAALMQVTAIAIVTSSFPAKKRGMALGINVSATYTGLSLGPFLGGILTQWLGWQSIFFVVVPIGIATVLLSFFTINEVHVRPQKSKFDNTGSVLLAFAFVGIVFGGGHLPAISSWIIWAVGVLLLVFFFSYEKKLENPVLNVNLLKSNKIFAYSNIAALIHYSATFGIGFLLSLYLQVSKGLSPREAGLILIVQPVFMAVSAPITGRLSDKVRPGLLASLGMLFTLIGLICLIFLTRDSSISFITGILVFLGLGFGLFSSPNTNAIMSSVDRKDYGIASGITSTMRIFGQTFSMMLVTIFLTLFIGNGKLSPEMLPQFMKTMRWCFVIFALLSVAGIWFSMNRGKYSEKA